MDTATYLQVIEALWYVSVGSQVILIGRMYRAKLVTIYPWWMLFLTTSATFSACLAALGTRHPNYRLAWAASNLTTGIMLCGAIIEVLSTLRRQYPYTGGLKLGHRAMLAASVLFIATGLLQASEHFPFSDPTLTVVCAVVLFRKYACLTAAVLLIGAWQFFGKVRPMLTQNIQHHGFLLSIYCFCVSVLAWAYSCGFDQQLINIMLTSISAALYLRWGFALKATGETRLPFFSDEEAAHAMARRKEFLDHVRVLFSEIRWRVRG